MLVLEMRFDREALATHYVCVCLSVEVELPSDSCKATIKNSRDAE
jgi:hypothetical protein